jgi:hypothetical protein
MHTPSLCDKLEMCLANVACNEAADELIVLTANAICRPRSRQSAISFSVMSYISNSP